MTTNDLFLSGNRTSKPLICVVTHGQSLFYTHNLTDPFDALKESMKLLVSSIFAKASCNTGTGCR